MLKLVEQPVVKQLMQHTNSNNLDNPQQSVCETDHSTKTALLHIKNEIHLSRSCGEPTAPLLRNLSAGFDTVDHTTFINCLKSWFGVCSMVLKWFMPCLSHQFQAFEIESYLSKICGLQFRVKAPWSLLFSSYTTPLMKSIGMHPTVNSAFMQMIPSCLYQDWLLKKLNSCHLDVEEWVS